MATGPRIESLLLAVWSGLGGGALRNNRAPAFWRDGDGNNVALDPAGGRWFDHAAGSGGGVLDLVQTAKGCDRREALAWMAENFGIAIGSTRTAAERREFARRTEAARLIATRLIERRDEAFNAIRDAKRIKLEDYHRVNGVAHNAEDIELLAKAEELWVELEALDAEGDELLGATDAAKLELMLSERRAA